MSHPKSSALTSRSRAIRCGLPCAPRRAVLLLPPAHAPLRPPPQFGVLRFALLKDAASIQAALMEVVDALLRDTLELKRGALVLRALHIRVRKIHRVRFDFQGRDDPRDPQLPRSADGRHRRTSRPPPHLVVHRRGPKSLAPGRPSWSNTSEATSPPSLQNRKPIQRRPHERKRPESRPNRRMARHLDPRNPQQK